MWLRPLPAPNAYEPRYRRPTQLRPPSMDVQVDADEDERPERGRKHRRDHRFQRVEVRPVVMARGHDPARDQVDRGEPADAEARTHGRCTKHSATSFPTGSRTTLELPDWLRR